MTPAWRRRYVYGKAGSADDYYVTAMAGKGKRLSQSIVKRRFASAKSRKAILDRQTRIDCSGSNWCGLRVNSIELALPATLST